MAQPAPAQRMEHVIRTYIQACNDADAAAIAACFCPEAVHYFPAPFVTCMWVSQKYPCATNAHESKSCRLLDNDERAPLQCQLLARYRRACSISGRESPEPASSISLEK
jgi:hypothetical protein